MSTGKNQSVRYVVLRHEAIADPHFDFMLEIEPGKPLTTWRLPVWPLTSFYSDATRLDDHRNTFLTYQGPLSKNRGAVRRVETGECEVQEASDVAYKLILPPRRSVLFLRDVNRGRDNKARRVWRACLIELRA